MHNNTRNLLYIMIQTEGYVPYFYRDTAEEGFVTIGNGINVHRYGRRAIAALEITCPGIPSGPDQAEQIATCRLTCFDRVRAMQSGNIHHSRYNRWLQTSFRHRGPSEFANCGMDRNASKRLTLSLMDRTYAAFLARQDLPLASYPPSAQAAILRLAWGYGVSGFLRRTGPMRALLPHIRNQDWDACVTTIRNYYRRNPQGRLYGRHELNTLILSAFTAAIDEASVAQLTAAGGQPVS